MNKKLTRRGLLVSGAAIAGVALTTVPAAVGAAPRIPAKPDLNVLYTLRRIADEVGVSYRLRLSMFETAWVESHANNLNFGDRDSLGVFQQRPSQGWGTPEQCMDVEYATNNYLHHAIINGRRDQQLTAGQLAQSVQRSAFPERYDEARSIAEQLIRLSYG